MIHGQYSLELPNNSVNESGSTGEEIDFTNNEFLLHGLDTIVGSTPTFSADYTSGSSWTQVGTHITITGGYAYHNNGGSAHNDFIHTPIGSTLSDDFVAEFEYYNFGSGAINLYPLVLAAGTGTVGTSNQDGIFVNESNPNMLQVRYKDGSGSTTGSGNSASMSSNTQYYNTLIRDGQVLTLTMYTDPERTLQHGSTLTTTIPSGTTIEGLNTLHHTARSGVGGGTSGYDYKIRDVVIYDGITSIVQGGDFLTDKSINSVQFIPLKGFDNNFDFSTEPTGWGNLDTGVSSIIGDQFNWKSVPDNSNNSVWVPVGSLGDDWSIRMKVETVSATGNYGGANGGSSAYYALGFIGLVEDTTTTGASCYGMTCGNGQASFWLDSHNLGITIGERYKQFAHPDNNMGVQVVEGGSIISGGTTWGSSANYGDLADDGGTVWLELKLEGGYNGGTFTATTFTDDTYSTVYSGGHNVANGSTGINAITTGNASPNNISTDLTMLVFKEPMAQAVYSSGDIIEVNIDDITICIGTEPCATGEINSTTGTIGTAIQDPNLIYTDSNLPDNTDTLSLGGFVKLDPGTSEPTVMNYITSSGTNEYFYSNNGGSQNGESCLIASQVGESGYGGNSVITHLLPQTGNQCAFQTLEFDLTPLGDITVTDANLRVDVNACGGGGSTGLRMTAIDQSSYSGYSWENKWKDASGLSVNGDNSATVYFDNWQDWASTGNDKVKNISSSDFHADVSANTGGMFIVGFTPATNDAIYAGANEYCYTSNAQNDVELELTYTYEVPPANTKLLGLNDVTFNVGATTASVDDK